MHYTKRSAYRELHHCTIFLIDLPKIEFHKIQKQRKEKLRYDVESIQQTGSVQDYEIKFR